MSYQFADINGVRLHYDVQGEGDALVLLHEGIADLRMFDDQMPAFSEHFRVVRFDVRGFGQTPDPPGKYTDHDDMRALLQHLGIDRTHVLGMSRGGRVAIDFALTFPVMLGRLVLVAPAVGGFDYPSDPIADELDEGSEEAQASGDFDLSAELNAKLWVDGPTRTPEQVDPDFRQRIYKLVRETVAITPGEGEGASVEPPAAGRLNEIKAPTLLLIGEHDCSAMQAVGDALAANVPDIKRVIMTNTAHVPNMEKAEEFNRLVLDFLLDR